MPRNFIGADALRRRRRCFWGGRRPTRRHFYHRKNLLTGHSATVNGIARTFTWTYDPLMRLHYQTTSGLNSRTYAMDGDNAILTYVAGPDRWMRSVYGPGENEVLYTIDHLSRRTWFAADERGSIVATTDATGAAGNVTTYDEYGRASSASYQHNYTGALIMGVSGLNYMRARVYDPTLGRFLQTDPIGYGDGMNMYGYVGGDPINATDPSGLAGCTFEETEEETTDVCAETKDKPAANNAISPQTSGGFTGFYTTPGMVGLETSPYEEGGFIDVVGTREPVILAGGRGRRRGRGGGGARPPGEAGNGSAEHRRGARPSTKGQHEGGQARRRVDRGGERADQDRRPPRRRPPGWRGPWPPPRFWPFPIFPGIFDICGPYYNGIYRDPSCGPLVA